MADEAPKTVQGEVVPWDDNRPLPALIAPSDELWESFKQAILQRDNRLLPEIGDPSITARMILERTAAGTFEESLRPAEKLPSWKRDYLDVPVVVGGFHLNPSSFVSEDTETAGVYAVVELMTSDGEVVTVQTGGENVLMQLGLAWKEQRFPFKARLVEKKTSTPGRGVLWLEAA